MTKAELTKMVDIRRKCLADGVCGFFQSYDISCISGVLSDSAFYLSNPDDLQELSKESVIELLNNHISLLAGLSELYSRYTAYHGDKERLKEKE